MKKRTLCLLLAGTMALSLLSGCGSKKTADDKEENPLNSFAAGVGNGGVNGGGNGGGDEEFDPPNPWNGEEEDPTPAVDEGPFARDPRWDELQPGESAVQYYDIFIKSGMTLGEATEAVVGSDVYQEQSIKWGITDLDEEFTVAAPKAIKISTPDGYETVTERGFSTDISYASVSCDGEIIMTVYYLTTLPGEESATYYKRDLPVVLVSGPPYYTKNESILTFIGWVSDIWNMGQQDVEDLLEIYRFRGPGTEMETKQMQEQRIKYMNIWFNSSLPLSISCNGYSFWTCPNKGEPFKGLCGVNSQFVVRIDKDKMDKGWSMDYINGVFSLYWAPDDAG